MLRTEIDFRRYYIGLFEGLYFVGVILHFLHIQTIDIRNKCYNLFFKLVYENYYMINSRGSSILYQIEYPQLRNFYDP